jgi:hypothetical protein
MVIYLREDIYPSSMATSISGSPKKTFALAMARDHGHSELNLPTCLRIVPSISSGSVLSRSAWQTRMSPLDLTLLAC